MKFVPSPGLIMNCVVISFKDGGEERIISPSLCISLYAVLLLIYNERLMLIICGEYLQLL